MKTKELIYKASQVFANNGLRQITAVLVSIFIANLYGPQGRGEFVLFTTVTAIASLTLSFGIVSSLVYQIKLRLISVKQSVIILILHFLIGIFISLVSIWFLKNFTDILKLIYRYEFYQLIILYSLHFMITPLSLFIVTYLLAIDDLKTYRNYMILTCAASILGYMGVYLINVANIVHPVVILVLVETVVVFLMIKKIISNDIINQISYHQLKIIYEYAFKGYLSSLSSMIFGRIENIIIPFLSSIYVLGIYSISKTFYNIIISIPTAFSGYMFGVYCDNKIEFNIAICLKVIAIILLISLISIIFIFYFLEDILVLIFGSEFLLAIAPARILVISAIVLGITMPINSLFFAIGKPGISSIIGFVSIISTILMMIFLIPKYSLIGAAYSSLFGTIVISLLRCYFFIEISLNIKNKTFNFWKKNV